MSELRHDPLAVVSLSQLHVSILYSAERLDLWHCYRKGNMHRCY